MKPSELSPKILFQGDSITDCSRDREIQTPSKALGNGYVSMVAESHPEWAVFNRGISGNRVVDLYARWKPDAIHLEPDIISILVGVNDTWHESAHRNGVEVPRYAAIYRLLLEWTVSVLPGVRLVLCEPFELPTDDTRRSWRPEMDERRAVVAGLAKDFNAILVPFQQEFDKALEQQPPEYWAPDGVHPSPEGHRLMADCWLRHVSPAPTESK